MNLELFRCDQTESISHFRESVILFVGRLSAENGLDLLIRSFRHIAETMPHIRLVIVGDGELRDELQTLARSLGLDGQVEISGPVSHGDVPRYLKLATVGVFPFLWRAGAGNVVFEAMASGLPLVVSEVNDTIRKLADAKCLLGVPPNNEKALTQAIMKLLSDADLRKSYVINGRRYIQEHLSDDHVFSSWETLIHKAKRLR